MIAAKDFHITANLKTGMPVTIRAVKPDDKPLINEAFRNLEPDTVYTRYFYHKTFLSEADLKWATELDFINDIAIVATIFQDDQEVVIGGSRYSLLTAADDAPKHAEIAFTVEEDYQGQGMAKLLFKNMIDIARSQGIAAFEAEVLAGNNGMMAVFERSGLPQTKQLHGGTNHLVMHL